MDTAQTMAIEVVLAMPRKHYLLSLSVPVRTCARDALRLALEGGMIPPGATDVDIDVSQAPLGIYAERIDDDHELKEGDRLEIYRPLQQNPMELRRKRARDDPKRKPGK